MKNDLATVVLLVFIDSFFSFGVCHVLRCLFNAPISLVSFAGCFLTILANVCVFTIRNLK